MVPTSCFSLYVNRYKNLKSGVFKEAAIQFELLDLFVAACALTKNRCFAGLVLCFSEGYGPTQVKCSSRSSGSPLQR